MLDLQRLRLLRELSRRGTVTAVAQALSFSPSAVSQQLATLERETGAVLLERFGRRVKLTAQGEVLVAHADTLLAEVERAETALAAAGGAVTGTLRVAAFQTAVMSLLPDALTALARIHPDLRVEVTELEPEAAVPAMVVGDFDIVVAEEYPGQPLAPNRGVERTAIGTDELLLVVPADEAPSDLVDLASRAFVMEPPGTTARSWAVSMCREAGFEPDVRFTTTDLQIHLALVEHGLAVGLVPALSSPRRAGVTVRSLAGAPQRRILALVRAGTRRRPDIDALIDVVAATVPGATGR